MKTLTIPVLALLVSTTLLGAQSLSSPVHFVSAQSLCDGGRTASAAYEVVASFGHGVVAAPMTTVQYTVTGGFNAAIHVPATGSPILSAVGPSYATLRGQDALTLLGTEFTVGSSPTVKIGGQTATILSIARDKITTTLPIQPKPGWQAVEVTTSAGTTVLGRGVGVLPLVETRPAPASEVAMEIVFKGTRGDTVHWAVSIGETIPMPMPNVHYALTLNPVGMFVFMGFRIINDDGELRILVPALKYAAGMVYLQAMVVTTNPGYAHASFTNVIRL